MNKVLQFANTFEKLAVSSGEIRRLKVLIDQLRELYPPEEEPKCFLRGRPINRKPVTRDLRELLFLAEKDGLLSEQEKESYYRLLR
jgi:hypothetical protein